MKKLMIFISLCLMASACYAVDKNTIDVTDSFNLPSDMKGCKIYRMSSDGFLPVFLYVTRCPSGKTETTKLDKTPTTVLMDDE